MGLIANERSSLFIQGNSSSSSSDSQSQSNGSLTNPEQCENGKGQCRPMDQRWLALMNEDGPQRPSDCNASREVTLSRRESVSSSGGLEKYSRN